MLYPNLTPIASTRLWTEQFIGLDRRPRTADGAFSGMGNMSGERWPLLASRKKRGLVKELEEPRALGVLGKLFWIDGSTLYFDGQATPINDLSEEESMMPKKIVTMGAYILIFPDGAYYNTADATDYGRINRLWQAVEYQEIRFELCDVNGTAYDGARITVSAAQPPEPEDGDYWINTESDPHALYQWSEYNNQWVGISSVYVKISATGIGKGLNAQDGVKISGIQYTGDNEEVKKQLEGLNETHVLWGLSDDYIVVVGILDQACVIRGGMRADRLIPEMDYIIECNNRLWGCRYGEQDGETVNRIYASALGDFRNFQKYLGTSQDSYWVTVGTDGPFTGAAAFRGYPQFFKADCVHTIYGEKPSNFQMQVTECEGPQMGSGGTIAQENGALFYLSAHGPMLFESMPQKIGQALGDGKLTGGSAIATGGIYYLSAGEESGEYSLYTFDESRGAWHRQDGSRALGFAALEGEVYMLEENGCLWALGGQTGEPESQDVTWFAETAVMGYEYPDHKRLRRFLFRLKLAETADCRLLIQYDSDGLWREKGSMQGRGKTKTYLLPVIPRRCEHLQLRIEGHGDMELWGIARELTMGGAK